MEPNGRSCEFPRDAIKKFLNSQNKKENHHNESRNRMNNMSEDPHNYPR